MVGTVTYYGVKTYCDWYARDGVGHIGQFGVLPDYQGFGIGERLLGAVQALALNDGGTELALDTAESAAHLRGYYEQRRYQFVSYVQWEGKTYRSVIMSKPLR